MMFCPNCAGKLETVDNENLMSQDLWGGDYYTHFCSTCETYWHLHLTGDEAVLISTKSQEIASKKIKDDLAKELRKRADDLGK